MEKLKLTEKQTAVLSDIQAKKGQIQQTMAILNDKEQAIVELIFENANVVLSKCTNLNLDNGHITYELIPEVEKKKDKKVKKLEPTPSN